jgi:hypothetical protein
MLLPYSHAKHLRHRLSGLSALRLRPLLLRHLLHVLAQLRHEVVLLPLLRLLLTGLLAVLL